MAKANSTATAAGGVQTISVNQEVEVCKKLFGQYPEDVLGTIDCASNALMWLAEIFKTIASEALTDRNYRIKHLAEAGKHLANDIGDYAGGQHADLLDCLRKADAVSVAGDAS